ncbi:hypothetical protein OX284_003390 [Flavobacterium sp. SUN046]|uniref:hypothetical protein n=1 Tax=Flavobacterium sp. SUN046 TaxID=3002440 RepID=UPI002DBAA2C9|nr:hypothetical protein [Flavobacterium sp. SUN046]MEC4048461.1 hypothetical protein [Flavobacterium sp. SUN046]
MGRYGNYPTTVEDCLIFRLKSLTENNNTYLTSYGTQKGVTSWSSNGLLISTINIEVTFTEYEAYIILDYSCNGEPKRYKVNLVSKVSNLGKGLIWFFVCPSTGKLCRKLYLNSGYFLHRTAFKSMMYSKQIESKKYRSLGKVFEACFITDEVYNELYKKYFKTHYNDKPTKRYLKLKNKIDLANSYPPNMEEILLMM